jgi:hypothetical protein
MVEKPRIDILPTQKKDHSYHRGYAAISVGSRCWRSHRSSLDRRSGVSYRMVGTHRRIPFTKAIEYKRKLEAQSRATLAELVAYDQEIGL